jgi:hypothetical protein
MNEIMIQQEKQQLRKGLREVVKKQQVFLSLGPLKNHLL